jgi:hypothetical protein
MVNLQIFQLLMLSRSRLLFGRMGIDWAEDNVYSKQYQMEVQITQAYTERNLKAFPKTNG